MNKRLYLLVLPLPWVTACLGLAGWLAQSNQRGLLVIRGALPRAGALCSVCHTNTQSADATKYPTSSLAVMLWL